MTDTNFTEVPAAVEPTPEGIVNFLGVQTQAHWNESSRPFLLSDISPALKLRGVDYRSVLGELKLKEFVEAHQGDTFKVVVHPTQKAKIGLVPGSVDFAFDPDATAMGASGGATTESSARFGPGRGSQIGLLVGFLKSMSHLSDEELDSVIIPTRVLVKLVSRR